MPRTSCYPSDLTDAQWVLIERLLPPPAQTGRPKEHPRRDIVDGILYVARAGGSWRQLPGDYPPWQTVYWHFARGEKEGVTQAVHDALRARLRIAEGRQVEPTAGIVDSQSVKGADTVGRHSRGYDAGKKVNGRKRFIAVDTLGLLLAVLVTPASVHDTAGGRRLLLAVYVAGRRLRHLFTDSGFAGTLPRRSASRSPGSPARVVGTRLIRPWQARGEVEVLRCPGVQQAVLSHAIVAAALGGLDGRARQPVNRLLWW